MKAEMLFARAAPEMTDWQRLNPDVAYRFNELFGEMWRTKRLHKLPSSPGDEKIVYVVPAFLSKSTRTFHWLTVHHTMWTAGEMASRGQSDSDAVLHLTQAVSALKDLKRDLEETNNIAEWSAFLADLPDHVLRGEMTDTIERLLSQGGSLGRDEHHALLWMYSGYHQSIKKHLEGILYKCLKCSKTESSATYFRGRAKRADPSHDEVDWFAIDREQHACDVSLANSEDVTAILEAAGEGEDRVRAFESCHGVEYSADTEAEAQENAKRYWREAGTARETRERIARTLMIHLLASPKSFGERFALFEHMALVPLFDHWIGGQGYGGIKAAFILAFTDSDTCTGWLESYLRSPTASDPDAERRSQGPNFEGSFALADAFADLAASVAESAQTLAVASNIEPPYDLMEHFLSVLKFVQDWESAVVFRNGTFQYGYRRRAPNGTSNKWGWDRSEKRDDFACLEEVRESEEIATVGTRRFLWWTASKPNLCLWNKAFLPSLGDQEATAFGSCAIRFEFPKVARVPPLGPGAARLREAYLREQLELMRRLIPVVRARRNALRNAAVSIMARNMSHNIGSHVLAAVQRAAEGLANVPTVLDAGFLQDSRVLHEHLQRRMDFIAELSTAESFYSPARMFFRDVLGLGDAAGQGFASQKLLLKHIAAEAINGKPISAGIEKRGSSLKDYSISCAGGMLGEQATYVILENMIRNSAKHCRRALLPERLKLYVNLDEAEGYPDYLRIRIWDELGQAHHKREGEHQTPVESINAVFGAESEEWRPPHFIEQSGEIVREKWGLREMYIAAAYLREIPLVALEARVSEGPSPLLKAIAVDGNLGYEFFVPKSRLLAVVFDDDDRFPESLREDPAVEARLAASGVRIFNVSQVEDHLRQQPVRYRDVIWLGDDDSVTLSARARTQLPRRVVCRRWFRDTTTWFEFSQWLRKGLREVENPAAASRLTMEVRRAILACHNSDALLLSDFEVLGSSAVLGRETTQESGDERARLRESLKSLSDTSHAIVFDGHGAIWEKIIDSKTLPESLRGYQALARVPFYETFRTLTPQRVLLQEWWGDFDRALFDEELKCAAGTAVVILDERVQREVRSLISSQHRPDGASNGFLLGECLSRAGVYVPDREEVDLERPNVGAMSKYLERLAEDPEGMVLGRIEYIVVHQTILDKVGLTESARFERTVAALSGKAAGCEIVICSGRGIPTQAYHGGSWPRFVPISSLLEHVVSRPSKIHLVLLLEASRAPHL